MTNEELDEARASEAWRLYIAGIQPSAVVIAARLAREGWIPIDPDLLLARDIAQKVMSAPALNGSYPFGHDKLEAIRTGKSDWTIQVRAALAAIKHCKEMK